MAFIQPPSTPILIKTKLSAPQRRNGLVLLLRLLSLLSQSITHSLILISAPAGYGKTTLLIDWITCLHQKEGNTEASLCWLSLDEGDDNPVQFLSYFLAAWGNVILSIQEDGGTSLEQSNKNGVQRER